MRAQSVWEEGESNTFVSSLKATLLSIENELALYFAGKSSDVCVVGGNAHRILHTMGYPCCRANTVPGFAPKPVPWKCWFDVLIQTVDFRNIGYTVYFSSRDVPSLGNIDISNSRAKYNGDWLPSALTRRVSRVRDHFIQLTQLKHLPLDGDLIGNVKACAAFKIFF